MTSQTPDPQRGRRVLGVILAASGAALGALMLLGFLSRDLTNIAQPEVIGGLIAAALLSGIPVLAGLYLVRGSSRPAAGPERPQAGPAVPARANTARPRLGALRIIAIIIGMLIILFAGACGFVILSLSSGYDYAQWENIQVAFLFAGIPGLIGIAIEWAALRAGR